ncbi:cation:proton antiporter [Rathayibacter tritici]|uniref:Na+/H+ antiporter n=1 Tax=Rathayibacter tritici TaxID=33888 RepID=A0A160KVH6_9MICO|nr:sodium:proton antiporter [Rathayibacter tritici]AND17699.1 Na+/H+ antiporter [Rathayibacter tritici]PPI49150.1 sodium:proton antiporter [Rathayibacter tritici]
MQEPVVAIVWIVSFVVVTVLVTGLSGRVNWSAPVALVAVGALASFVPGIPEVVVEPDVVLFGILPPLLYAAAIRTSVLDVRARGDSILLLSIGLVVFTVAVVGAVAWMVVPAITLAAALAFGAIVAPTDAVAVTAIAGRLRLPRRMLTVLEGESLLNDATALVALNAALLAIVSTVTPGRIALDFVLAVAVGGGVGIGIAVLLGFVRKQVQSSVLDTSLSLVTPYVAFIPAQLLHGSGVLAVVVAGLYLGYRAPVIQSAQARIAESLNWRTIQFLLENAVFLFIGLSLSSVVRATADSGVGVWQTVGIGAAVLAALIGSRVAWMCLTTLLFRHGPNRLRQRGWTWPTAIGVSFAGIRGVVTLAAAFLLPEETPQRAFLQFLAFVVVAGTLVEGLALPRLVRALKLPAPNEMQEHVEKQMLLAEAQAAGLSRLDEEPQDGVEDRVLDRLRRNATFLADALQNPPEGEGVEPLPQAYNRLRRVMIAAEREAVLRARAQGRYQEPAVVSALAFLDVEEEALAVGRQ